ncbi:hypothetical protein [Nocardia sp. CY41]|uniref:hypothetical protein n=1 Tax=Nocardia sp. CY41 TaxID=2608686 RepID=UPI001357F691|nr:hypothetical protein [Nocardia sp. CY41]
MDEIEYVFGTGDGSVHVWTSEADLELGGTGAVDAVRLDFDGDGIADDALWDPACAGRAEVAALDLDDDGVPDHFFTDPTGLGTWNHEITGLPADAASEPLDWIVRTDADAPERLVDDQRLSESRAGSEDVGALPEHLAHWLNRARRDPGDDLFLS